ncbi:hypothetical protein PPERSA_02421 [Pseudocohnilembus persalinus]|uniref:Uncharacterized protein n=1 Tax=Pseudocohnilembus persalinus TaxID=266149 RepID=A0A0V0QAP1_PSEPJ|nr:hypothetical protein PPERSA_02421 [Pseudocohnilembus persalinus]|eukprot:KRW99309.1 hypothetical protein PPERSA_02421 [Pseudocohnilembus persalinus]
MQKQITSQIAPKTKTISSEENIDDKNIKFSRNPSNYNSLKIDSEQQYYNYNYDPNQIDIYQNNNNINNSSIDEQSESSDSEDQQNSEKLERQMELEQIQIDELMKQTQTKLYQKAELREKQFIEIQNKIVSQNLNIINVPIKLDKVYPTTKKNIEKENKALLQQDKKKKSNSSKSKCGLSFYKNNKNNSNKYTTKMHYQTTQSSQQLDPETNQNNNKEFQFIHTLEYGENDNPIILLLHGYSGTSVSFINLIDGLSTHFKIQLGSDYHQDLNLIQRTQIKLLIILQILQFNGKAR